jgi:hypothetical protein
MRSTDNAWQTRARRHPAGPPRFRRGLWAERDASSLSGGSDGGRGGPCHATRLSPSRAPGRGRPARRGRGRRQRRESRPGAESLSGESPQCQGGIEEAATPGDLAGRSSLHELIGVEHVAQGESVPLAEPGPEKAEGAGKAARSTIGRPWLLAMGERLQLLSLQANQPPWSLLRPQLGPGPKAVPFHPDTVSFPLGQRPRSATQRYRAWLCNLWRARCAAPCPAAGPSSASPLRAPGTQGPSKLVMRDKQDKSHPLP